MDEDGDKIAAEARRLIREDEFSPSRFLRALDEGWYTDAELGELPAEQRLLLVAALQVMLPNRTGKIRLNVAQALLELGDPLGWQTFRECLNGDDAALRLGALERLATLPGDPEKRGYRAPIDADAVIKALERPLASASNRAREKAIHVLNRLKTPRAFDRLAQLVSDQRPDVRTEAAICLGDAGYDRGALAVIAEMLQTKGLSSSEHWSTCVKAPMPTSAHAPPTSLCGSSIGHSPPIVIPSWMRSIWPMTSGTAWTPLRQPDRLVRKSCCTGFWPRTQHRGFVALRSSGLPT